MFEKPQHRTFTFTVDEKGQFNYGPPATWLYNEGDTVDFTSPSGPFTIDFRRKAAPPEAAFNPLNGPLTAEETPYGQWVATVQVNSGLSDANKMAIWKANQTEEEPGFVASYVYVIDIETPQGRRHDEQHSGVFGC